MISLLKCEFKKFKGTYINSLSFLGMLIPVLLVTLMFIFKRSDWIKAGFYKWENFYNQLTMFFVVLVGPIITSFIAVFSIFYEYQEKTIKNILSSPYGRESIIISKIIYVSAYVIFQYAVVALISITCAVALGFDITAATVVEFNKQLVLGGVVTVILVPLMMFITLLSRSFIPAMVITVAGTISNVLLLNWEKSYLSPWAAPVDIFGIMSKKLQMDIAYPIASTCLYFVLFMIAALVYFRTADQGV